MSDAETKSQPAATKQALGTLDINQIMARIPHRYPFLLIDKVIDIVDGESGVGIKNVTINEPFFQGHFPQRPVMPGVLIIEAMAQTAGVLVVSSMKDPEANKIVYFMTIDDARFRRPVLPGDRLEIHVRKQRNRGPVWRFSGQAKVDGVTVAEATYSAMIVEESAAKSAG
jgi:3-hydroxyacyl-[acyl-carrier-protein] dehydratase